VLLHINEQIIMEQCAPVLLCLNCCESKHSVVWLIHEVFEFKDYCGCPKAYVCGRSPAEIVGSNPAGGMDVCLLCVLCVLSSRGLCDELITRPKWSYRLWCVVVCDLETSSVRRPWLALGRNAIGKENDVLNILI